jgi:hypothetical protein
VEGLKKLERTFVFSREGAGSLTVEDTVELAAPQQFGTALVTFSRWKQPQPTRLVVGEGAVAVAVDVATDGPEIRLETDKIEEDLPGGRIPTRLGLNFAEPVTKATVTLKISPASAGQP